MICELCRRELGDYWDKHHLVPKTFGGKETIALHKICHRTIHATFTERQLEKQFNTIEALREHPEIQRFVEWVASKPIDFYVGTDETKQRKKKRR